MSRFLRVSMMNKTVRNRAARRRGAAYLLFLVTASVVMLIGLAAMTFTRAEVLRASSTGSVSKARMHALSAIDVAVLYIQLTGNWRSKLINDHWSQVYQVGSTGGFAYKVVDEIDGDLANDESTPVRVYGRGVDGDSTWIYSVLVQPPPTAGSVSSRQELIANGSFDSGLTPWFNQGSGRLKLKQSGTDSSDGPPFLNARNRTSAEDGPRQQLTKPINQSVTYLFECELRADDDDDEMWVELRLDTSKGPMTFTIVRAFVTSSWTKVAGTVTPVWDGQLNTATLAIGTTNTVTAFNVDGVTMTPIPTALIGPVPGTLRREAAP